MWPTEFYHSRVFIEHKMVYCALYVDDKGLIADSTQWYFNSDGSLRKSLSAVNRKIQEDRFDTNAQPFYAVLDPKSDTVLFTLGYSTNLNRTYELIRNYYSH